MTTLVLLVGANPLPNYVTAVALLNVKKVENVVLIATAEIVPVSSRLELAIRAHTPNVRTESIKATATNNLKDMSDEMERVIGSIEGNIHLNYTGGRKTMSVAAYRAVMSKRPQGAIFSYLDDKKHRIYYEDGTFYPNDGTDLRHKVEATLETLLALHDCKPPKTVREPQLSFMPIVMAMSAFRLAPRQGDASKAAYEQFRAWIKAVNNDAKNLDLIKHTWPDNPLVRDLGKAITDCVIAQPENRSALVDFLMSHGTWLEYLVWSACKQLEQNPPLDIRIAKVVANYKPRRQDATNFELDCVLIRGYEVLGFSCYIGNDREEMKHKAFEALHRAAQIGGEEARAVLVMLADKDQKGDDVAEGLEDDLANDYGIDRSRLHVFGRAQVARLNDELQAYLSEKA